MLRTFKKACTGNTAVTNMLNTMGNDVDGPQSGVPCGVYVALGTATSADVVIKDSRGYTIFTKATIVASTYFPFGDAAMVGTSMYGIPTVTATNVVNSSTGTFTVWLDFKVQ